MSVEWFVNDEKWQEAHRNDQTPVISSDGNHIEHVIPNFCKYYTDNDTGKFSLYQGHFSNYCFKPFGTNNPYLGVGNHTVHAKITYDNGVVRESSRETITIKERPTNNFGSKLMALTDRLSMYTDAHFASGYSNHIEWHVNDTPMRGSDGWGGRNYDGTVCKWSCAWFVWNGPPPGTHEIYAKVYTDGKYLGDTPTLAVTVH